jgi:hypothetical protein
MKKLGVRERAAAVVFKKQLWKQDRRNLDHTHCINGLG